VLGGDALVINNRVTLAVFYGLGGVLLVAIALTGVWVGVDRPLMAAVGIVALTVGAALTRVRRLSLPAVHALVAAGSAVISTAVWAAGGGTASAAVAMFTGWVVVYGALFFPRRQAAAHSLTALTATSLALSASEPLGSAMLHVILLVVITTSTGVIAGLLTRRTQALATSDALTGVLNAKGLEQVVARDLAAAGPGDLGMLVLLDLDRFGELNQALGRDGGDDLLRQLARAHDRGVEQLGVLARLGGDDFAVWLPRVPQPLQAFGDLAASRPTPGVMGVDLARLVQEVTRAASGPFEVAGVSVEVDSTLGVVLAPLHGVDFATLLNRADTALHAARRTDQPAMLWSPELAEHTAEGVQLQAQLRTALVNGELRLHYQPLIDAHSRQVRGVEALVRWQHPTRGLLAPGAFIPEAERTSVMVALTDWVLSEALDQAAAWVHEGRPLRVSVNLSARLIAHEGLADQVGAQLRRTGVPAHLLMLEVTESAVMTQPRRAASTLGELRAVGVRIALDDFGTGYTSLAMLQDLPLDELKVDRRFVAGALGGGGDEAIVRSVVQLAHRLGFEVVGEGVEDEATAHLLAESGYDLLQGYLFSRPVPAEQIPCLSFSRPTTSKATALSPALERTRAQAAELHAAAAGMDDAVLRELSALAARMTGASAAAVTFVGQHHQHVSATVGVSSFTGPREDGLCQHALLAGDLLQVPDASTDPRFHALPLVVAGPQVRFYAGAPISDDDGNLLGTVCVFDQHPRTLSADQVEVLRTLARAASAHLTALTALPPVVPHLGRTDSQLFSAEATMRS